MLIKRRVISILLVQLLVSRYLIRILTIRNWQSWSKIRLTTQKTQIICGLRNNRKRLIKWSQTLKLLRISLREVLFRKVRDIQQGWKIPWWTTRRSWREIVNILSIGYVLQEDHALVKLQLSQLLCKFLPSWALKYFRFQKQLPCSWRVEQWSKHTSCHLKKLFDSK